MEYTTRRLTFTIWIIFVLFFAVSLIAFYGLNDVAYADAEVSYLEYNTSTKAFDTQTITTYIAIETTTDFSSGGTFVLNDNVALDTIDGGGSNDLVLILCDGKTLTLTGGIANCRDITIYAQELGTGKIVAGADKATGTFIASGRHLTIHGGEISTGAYNVSQLLGASNSITIHRGNLNGTVGSGINSQRTVTINNAIVDFTLSAGSSSLGIKSVQALIINDGTYTINGEGKAIYSQSSSITINGGIYNFTNVTVGIQSREDLTIDHGKINIEASSYSFKSDNANVSIRGRVFAQSEESPVVYANWTIELVRANAELVTHSATYGVYKSNHSSIGESNVTVYYKDTEAEEWAQSGSAYSKKYLKSVALYYDITIWVEDITVAAGTDVSSITIPYGFGIWDQRDQETQDANADLFAYAATLFSVKTNSDATTPGTYDYQLEFVPEYEGNIDDEYDIVFGDTIGHLIVVSEIDYLAYNTTSKTFETQNTTSFTIVDSTTDFSSGGTFVVSNDVTVGTINCGDNNLTLILCDGKTLTVNKITACNQLTIYAQEQGTGKIVASADIASGSLIGCYDMKIHGGEINTNSHSVDYIINCDASFEMYNGKIVGIATDGIYSYSEMVIENAIVDLEITDYGIASYSSITINDGTYNISGLGTAIRSDGNTLTINNGNYVFEDVDVGFYSQQDFTFNHGKADIQATNEAFYSYEGKVFIRGTRIYAQSEESNVIKAGTSINFSYVNFEGVTHSDTLGVLYTGSSATSFENTNEYYKDTEEGEWYKDNTRNEKSPTVKFFKVVALYTPITVWIEDMSVEEGTDISTITISYGFGIWNNRSETTLNNRKKLLSRAAALFSVSVDCDGTTPGTYDYILNFVPEYEGNIDDEYNIIFGDPIGRFTVTAAPPASNPDADTDPETPATPAPEQQSSDTNEPKNDEGANQESESYKCIGLVVMIVDAFIFFVWIFVIIYLMQNKKHPNANGIVSSKIARTCGLVVAVGALAFAIVAIIMHQCVLAICGIVWAAINVALFGLSFTIKFLKDQ